MWYMFLFGLASGLVFVVLYDWALDAWRKKLAVHLDKIQTSVEVWEAAKAHNFQVTEDWKERCLAAMHEVRAKCVRLGGLQEDVPKIDALIEEGQQL